MTKITIYKKNNLIFGFEISGHSGYADAGSDIVCSAISSISQSTCLGILKVLKINAKMQKNDKKAYLKLMLPKIDEESMQKAQILLLTMQLSIEDLLWDFSKYIQMEVSDEIY